MPRDAQGASPALLNGQPELELLRPRRLFLYCFELFLDTL